MNSSSIPPSSLLQIIFSEAGEQQAARNFDIEELNKDSLQYFQTRVGRLSGDLELPMEDDLPGDYRFLEYRIGSDLNGAYTLYYYHDEVIGASLFLRGRSNNEEIELMQVFKYLLLDDQDEDDPTDEQLDSILASTRFDFEKTTDRPIAFAIRFIREGVEQNVYQHVDKMDQHLAFAFCCDAENINS